MTLHHFTDPLWLYEMCGWENDAVVALFEKFVRKTVDALREYCSYWSTINEPNTYALFGYVAGTFPACNKGLPTALRVQANMLRGHAALYRTIHEIQKQARVGYALHYRPMISHNKWSPLDNLMRNIYYTGINMAFPSAISTGVMKSPIGNIRIPEAKGTQDYFGLNYYSVDTVRFDIKNPKEVFGKRYFPENSDLSENNFVANIPEGFYDSIKWAMKTYPNTPILITENGVEDAQDKMRPRYLAQHIHQLWRAVNFNWPVHHLPLLMSAHDDSPIEFYLPLRPLTIQ